MGIRKILTVLSAVALVTSIAGMASLSSTSSSVEFAPSAHAAAVDYFLKIEGVEGESTDDRHKGEIQIESFSWGASQPGIGQMGSGGGGGAGKVSVHDISITKSVDKASPVLMVSSATGVHFPRAVLTVRKSGDNNQAEYFKVTLSDVLISSYQVGGDQGSLPADTFSLNFSKIEFEYLPQNPDGSLGAPVKAGYDVKANKKV